MGQRLSTRSEEGRTDRLRDSADLDDTRVLEVLGSDIARQILASLDAPLTVHEIADRCDIPLSTVYRHVHDLRDVGILRESPRVTRNGDHPAEYAPSVERVTIELDDLTAEVE